MTHNYIVIIHAMICCCIILYHQLNRYNSSINYLPSILRLQARQEPSRQEECSGGKEKSQADEEGEGGCQEKSAEEKVMNV